MPHIASYKKHVVLVGEGRLNSDLHSPKDGCILPQKMPAAVPLSLKHPLAVRTPLLPLVQAEEKQRALLGLFSPVMRFSSTYTGG